MKKNELINKTLAGLMIAEMTAGVCPTTAFAVTRGQVAADGTYTKEIFKSRSESVSQNVARLNNSIEEYEARLEQEKIVDKEKAVLVPKIENLLDVYNLLKTPEEKNELLKTVITQVTYLKTEKAIKKDSDPTNFIINLYPISMKS